MYRLRREVELPARLHERASFYLGLGSFLLSACLVLDAALWAGPTVAVERAVTVRRLHPRPPCHEPPVAIDMREFHDQLQMQLDAPGLTSRSP